MKYQLKLWFSSFSISVCRRTANTVAHELASIGRLDERNHSVEWMSDVLASVAEYALDDLPNTVD